MTTVRLRHRFSKGARLFRHVAATAVVAACMVSGMARQPVGGQENAARTEFQQNFKTPPKGYGEVPFWWWTGERLDVERLIEQVDELAKKGISGVQVNYAHQDVRNDVQPNWLTYPNEPEIFTDEWFSIFEKVAERCRELNMGIGVSGYTLDWQNSPGNFFDKLIYSDRELQSRTLYVAEKIDLKPGEKWTDAIKKAKPETIATPPAGELADDDPVQIVAYPLDEKTGACDASACVPLGKDAAALQAREGAPETPVQVWFYRAKRVPHTLNALHPGAGKAVVDRFLMPFELRAKEAQDDDGTSDLGLNYFFQDELQLGTGELTWHDDVPEEFQTRKGYSCWTALPAFFGAKTGDRQEKYFLDYLDLRVRLAQERYFIPVYNWHAARGRIYGCDPGSRGRNPNEFCDYFSAIKWYTAPGHDTPGGRADFIKNKVSSSIAHFYERPRVWLEGYHSFGWGAAPERLLFATNENFLFGANLLNLHGLYYTTYGGYWEWAPPCYHFRQPWWETFRDFLKYFERLSWALTRGVEQTDFVVLYPVTPYHSRLGGDRARNVAFEAATRIFNSGRDVLFIDDDSIARAEIKDGKLCVSGGAHRVLVLPSIRGAKWQTLEKARELVRSGGVVIALDAAPEASDRLGRNDPQLEEINRELFGGTSAELAKLPESVRVNDAKGQGAFFSGAAEKPDPNASVVREYPGGFAGRWAWSSQVARNVNFKWIATGVGAEPKDRQILFLCDNSGALYLNGKQICSNADYSKGWRGSLKVKDGDVIVLDCVDTDGTIRRGSAGAFFAILGDSGVAATIENFRCTPEAPADVAKWRSTADGFDKLAAVDTGNVHVLHRTGVNTELTGAVAPGGDAQMWERFGKFVAQFDRDVYEAESDAPCAVMRRETPDADLFFVMRGHKDAVLSFRASGRAELFNAQTGESSNPEIVRVADGRTELRWPWSEKQAGLVLFWKNESNPEPKPVAPLKETARVALDGEWDFELLPTLDNRWGDFRLPVSERTIGAEAQRFDVLTAAKKGWDSAQLNDFGPKFMMLGPFPKDAPLDALEHELHAVKSPAPGSVVPFNGAEYAWKPYSFSWRWGIEGNPGRQGYHGLKEKIDSRFIGLGKIANAHNEKVYGKDDAGDVWYLWSTLPVKIADSDPQEGERIVDVFVGGGAPAAIWLGDTKLADGKLRLITGRNVKPTPVLIRYDAPGRRSCVFIARQDASDSAPSKIIPADGLDSGAYNGLSTGLREETPDFVRRPRTPLSTVWFDAPGVLDYDVRALEQHNPGVTSLRFVAPPGAVEFTVPSYAPVKRLLVDGKEARCRFTALKVVPGADFWQGKRNDPADGAKIDFTSRLSDRNVIITTEELVEPCEHEATVVVEIEEIPGVSGAGLCPEPIAIRTTKGRATLGNWNDRGALQTYSGGARYSKVFDLPELPTGAKVVLDLGAVSASCRVRVNGKNVADLSAAPWSVDVTEFVGAGKNTLEVDVYNTLANFYRNIPSNYKAMPESGLIGPVEVVVEAPEK